MRSTTLKQSVQPMRPICFPMRPMGPTRQTSSLHSLHQPSHLLQ